MGSRAKTPPKREPLDRKPLNPKPTTLWQDPKSYEKAWLMLGGLVFRGSFISIKPT